MNSSFRVWLVLGCTAINLFANTHSYVLSGCEPYEGDISSALADFVSSVKAANAALKPQQGRVIDWTGLIDSLYPGLSSNPDLASLWRTVPCWFRNESFNSVAAALDSEWILRVDWDLGVPEEDQDLDLTTLFICNPSYFVKVDPLSANPQWYDPDSRETFNITSEPEICPAGLKSRLAIHPTPPIYYVIILCPPSVTQTSGQPKMYGTLWGRPLKNDRPDSRITRGARLTTEITVNLQFWVGMHIDQLRERTLSVIIGRYILHILAQKYAPGIADRTRNRIPIRIMNGYESFDRAITMGWSGGLMNVDSYSLLMTGAALYYRELASRRRPGGNAINSLSVYRWNRQGYYYLNTDMNPNTMNDNAAYYGSD